MTTNNAFDQQKLIENENENPPPYQNTNNHGTTTAAYGTFAGTTGGSAFTTTTISSYPYAISSQQPTILVLGGCPACKTGMLETDFTFFGLCCAIFFFPIGILCCLAFRQRRCNFCGAIFT